MRPQHGLRRMLPVCELLGGAAKCCCAPRAVPGCGAKAKRRGSGLGSAQQDAALPAGGLLQQGAGCGEGRRRSGALLLRSVLNPPRGWPCDARDRQAEICCSGL